MSLKRSHASTRSTSSGAESGSKLGRQELFDELKKHARTGQVFTPVDISMAIGASEAAVSRALLGLAAEGYLEKVDTGKYCSTPFLEVPQAEFLKALARASKTDSTRQRDLSEIARLKQNNDVMRAKLLGALAERDHYLAVLKQHGIDPGPIPASASASPSVAGQPAPASATSAEGQPEAQATAAATSTEGQPGAEAAAAAASAEAPRPGAEAAAGATSTEAQPEAEATSSAESSS
jgi:hypothetical protein